MSLKSHALPWVVLSLHCAFANGQPRALLKAAPNADTVGVTLQVNRFVMPNGLRVVVNEDHSTPNVSLQLICVAGTRDEKAGQFGIAHLFEHLNSGAPRSLGTAANRSAYYSQTLDTNAQTRMDYVRYFTMVPAPALEMAVAVFADQLDNDPAQLTQERLDSDRAIVLNEFRRAAGRGLNDPGVQQEIRFGLFGGDHLYRHEVYGSEADISAASVDEMRAWLAVHRGARNAVLVVAGNTSTDTVRPLVERYFGSIAPGVSRPEPVEWAEEARGSEIKIFEQDVPRTIVSKSWITPAWGTADNDNLRLLGGILTAGNQSRLYQRLVLRGNQTQSVSISFDEWQLAGKFTISAVLTSDADPMHVVRELDDEIERLVRDGVTQAEVERTKGTALASAVRNLQDIGFESDRVQLLSEGELFRDDPSFYKTRLQRTAEATPKALQSTAQRWLRGGYLAIVKPTSHYTASTDTIDRTILPHTPSAQRLAFPAVSRDRLSNGLQLLVIEKHDLPLIDFRLLFDVGGEQNKATPEAALLAVRSMATGTKTRSADQIEDLLGKLGTRISTQADQDFVELTISSLSNRADQSLALLADMLVNPAFPPEQIDRIRSAAVSKADADRAAPLQQRWRILPAALWGKEDKESAPLTNLGEYVTQLAPGLSPERLKSMGQSDVVSYYQDCMAPSKATLIAVGDIRIDALKSKLNTPLANWHSAGKCPSITSSEVTDPTAGIYVIDQPGAAQSFILAAHPVPAISSDNVFGLEAATKLLNTRLNDNLRSKHGWSYGAEAAISHSRIRPFLYAGAPVQTDKTGAAMNEMLAEWRRAADNSAIPEDELERLRRNLLRPLVLSTATLESTSRAASELIRLGLPSDYYEASAQRVSTLTPEEVKKAAQKAFRPDHLVWIVVGDAKVILPQLKNPDLPRSEQLRQPMYPENQHKEMEGHFRSRVAASATAPL